MTPFSVLAVTAWAVAQTPAEPQKPQPGAASELSRKIEDIARTASEARQKLTDRQTGVPTRETQTEVIRKLDELLKPPPDPPPQDQQDQQQQPPPSSGGGEGGQGSPSGGQGSSGSGQSQSNSGQDKSSRGFAPNPRPGGAGVGAQSQQPSGGQQGADRQKAPGTDSAGAGGAGGRGDGKAGGRPGEASKQPPRPDRLADMYKDVWGHLPDKMRQELDLYHREQFMPRYSELLQQYYSNLSAGGRRRE